MKSKAILCFALVLSGGLWGCASADSQPKPDLAAFRIEQGPHEKSASNESADWIEWRNVLILTNAGIRVPLARSAIATFGDVSEKHGFDPGTLKLQWLKQDELLWISWTTFHLGSGGYTHNGNVILQIQGNRSHELFRDYFLSVAKAGWGAQNYASLKITYNDSDRILTFSRRSTEINGETGIPPSLEPFPFTETFTNDDGKPGYISEVTTVETRRYRLAGSKLKFLNGTKAVDVEDRTRCVEDIIKGFHVRRAALDKMNHGLRGERDATGEIIIDDKLGPSETSSCDGLHGDK